jgi:hypothetical protein
MTSTPATVSGATVGGLGGSPLLNVVHVVAGLLALAAALTRGAAQVAGMVGSIAFLALAAYDVVVLIAGQSGEPLSVRWPALVLHVLAWAAALAIVVTYYRRESVGD